jgi:redox-sensitive bicupin YhaK (pirin superfamily)
MKAGNGVWHNGHVLPGEIARAFQLWIALPPSQENSPAESQYVAPSELQHQGPVRVILGRYGFARSCIPAPETINYFHVCLNDGQRWRYAPPVGHNVAWLAIDEGRLQASEPIEPGRLTVFEESDEAPIDLQAEGATSFVIGSAVKHPYPLVVGYYSVHTSEDTLAQGETEIRRIGHDLVAQGRFITV